ncbi:TPA: hypothetical protein OWU47_002485 [Staphylococcus aureus]|nr:hypothetical protein GSF72_10245 [Staphylococcus aureus]CRI11693.1 putative membrane protein [Staphylococcus aureus]CRI11699.1 putative membrane protein [Staphylococcus aureus]CRI14428.1 putative membrane protein [Staphylococcus aureus]CRI18549.1 putative membrane protein [Staphylococcus aureus]
MQILLLIITTGIPGFYTYYALSNKNLVYFDSDNKKVILAFFSVVSVFIFLLTLSLFSGQNNVNQLFQELTFTKTLSSLIVSISIIIVLTELLYTKIIEVYNYFSNNNRKSSNLKITETLPVHLLKYEDNRYKMFITVKDFEGNVIEKGFLDNYSRKHNRNILLDTRFNDDYEHFLKLSEYKDSYLGFENQVKLEYLYIDKKKFAISF